MRSIQSGRCTVPSPKASTRRLGHAYEPEHKRKSSHCEQCSNGSFGCQQHWATDDFPNTGVRGTSTPEPYLPSDAVEQVLKSNATVVLACPTSFISISHTFGTITKIPTP